MGATPSTVPIWSFAKRVDRRGHEDAELLSVYRDYGVVPKASRDDNFNKESEDLSNYLYVEEGDLVLNKMKTWQGSLAVSKFEGIVSPAYFVCKLGHHVVPRYVHYLLRSDPLIAEYAKRSKGIRPNQWDLPFDEFKGIEVELPPVEEQRRIADFLDDHVTRMDELIALRTRQRVLIQERRAGEVASATLSAAGTSTRLARFASLQSGITVDSKRSPNDATEVPYLSVANVKAGWLALDDIKSIRVSIAEARRFALRAGDVLMTEGGDLDKLGRGTVWRGEIPGAIHQNHVFAVRTDPQALMPEFLAYYTASATARSYFEITGTKTTNLASTSASKVLGLPVPVIPISEQIRIVAYLDSVNATAALQSDAVDSSIELLEERKRAEITAAVTGELDVTTARPIQTGKWVPNVGASVEGAAAAQAQAPSIGGIG